MKQVGGALPRRRYGAMKRAADKILQIQFFAFFLLLWSML